MDIGEQQRVIIVEPEPVEVPGVPEPDPIQAPAIPEPVREPADAPA